jgi:hypothetical protein
VYERFTDRARKAMQLANQEAQRFNHPFIASEHILLGLVKESSGVAARVLKKQRIDLPKVRQVVEKAARGESVGSTLGKLPLMPGAKKIIEYSIEEARGLNHNHVGTEHLLLGLMREKDGRAVQVLAKLGLTPERVRAKVLYALEHPDSIGPSVFERAGRWLSGLARTFRTTTPAPRHEPGVPRKLPAEADRLAEMETRTRALEGQLANVRFLLGGVLGAGAGALVDDRLGAAVGLLVGGGVALFGRLIPAVLAGGVAGGYAASLHFGGEVAAVAGAVGGALLAACVVEIGRPSRPGKADGVPGREDPDAPKVNS